ncbi:MAG: carboxypeptidase regulatory-like domain-containing protein [Sedimentisphaerales bacterium]
MKMPLLYAIALFLFIVSPAVAIEYQFAWTTGSVGSGNGQFGSDIGPRGSVVVGNLLYVCDYSNNRIEWFDTGTGQYVGQKAVGTYLSDIDFDPVRGRFYIRTQPGGISAYDTNFNKLWSTSINTASWVGYGVAIDSQGNIHTPSSYYPYVYKLNPSGQIISQYDNPAGHSSIEAFGGFIYVSEGGAIRKYSEDGLFLGQVLTSNETPTCLTRLPGGKMAVFLSGPHQIAVYDSSWVELCRFGGPGSGPGQFGTVAGEAGIASDDLGNIYFSDGGNGGNYRVEKFALESTPPPTVTIRGTVYDSATNQPLSGATIVATGPKSIDTNENGQYEISGLSPGDIIVQSSKSNYGDSTKILDNTVAGQAYSLDFSLVPDIKCGFIPAENGFHFPNPPILGGGFCTGFTYSTLLFYCLHIPIPKNITEWYFNAWTNCIISAHFAYNAKYLDKIIECTLLSPDGGDWIGENINKIRLSTALGIPCPIILSGHGNHSVLAYKVAEDTNMEGSTYYIYVYDSRLRDDYVGVITASHLNNMWSMNTYSDLLFNRFLANPIITEIDFVGSFPDSYSLLMNSPASLELFGPKDLVINKNSPDEPDRYYRILDIDNDGHEEDLVFLLNPPEGQYSVNVIPDTNAEPNETYTLEENKFGKITVLAQDVPISEVPTEPYKSIVVLPALTCEQALALMDYNLVDQNRISRTEFEYTFRMRVANSWIHDINDITIRLIQGPNNTTVLDDTISFETIQAGTEALSDDTFKIRTDRTIEGLKSDVVWKICDCKMERKTDFNRDWVVNFLDFAAFADNWLSIGNNIPQDVYPDEKVDIMDLGVFADEWLK